MRRLVDGRTDRQSVIVGALPARHFELEHSSGSEIDQTSNQPEQFKRGNGGRPLRSCERARPFADQFGATGRGPKSGEQAEQPEGDIANLPHRELHVEIKNGFDRERMGHERQQRPGFEARTAGKGLRGSTWPTKFG
jgi:hypothetical protein